MILPTLAHAAGIVVAKDIVEGLIDNDDVELVKIFYFDESDECINFPCEVEKVDFFSATALAEFDILHSHTLRTDLYLFMHKIFRNIKHSKLVSTLHQYNYINLKYLMGSKWKAYIVSSAWNIFLSKHDKIIVLSKDMKMYYKKRLLNKKIDFIYNGRPEIVTNLSFRDEKLEQLKKHDAIIIGTTCRIINIKGLEQVIKSLQFLNDTYFVILGSGEDEEYLKKLSVQLNVDDRCLFLGFKKNPLDYYKYFDLFILPSRREGFPLSLIEAASMKKAIVSSSLGVIKETFTEDEVTFFDLDNMESLLLAIHKALDNKATLSLNVYQKYLSAYTSKKMSDEYLLMYNELIKKNENNSQYKQLK